MSEEYVCNCMNCRVERMEKMLGRIEVGIEKLLEANKC